MQIPGRLRTRTRVVGVLLGVLLIAGCSRSAPKLEALKADPMATVAIPGVRIVREFESPEGEALGKPLIADFNRSFVVTEGEPRDIVRAVRELAEANGWTTDHVDRDTYLASKTLAVNGNHPWADPAELNLAFHDRTSGNLRMTQE
jgi:hypothetical protein